MAYPPKQMLDIWKGNTFHQEFILNTKENGELVPVNLVGSTIVFTVTWGLAEGMSFMKSFSNLPDANIGKFVISLTVEESRLFPLGQIAKYEIERQISMEQKTLLCGTLNVGGWNNVD